MFQCPGHTRLGAGGAVSLQGEETTQEIHSSEALAGGGV